MKIIKKIYFIIFLASLFLSFVGTVEVRGAGLVPCGGEGEPDCQLCHLFVMINNIIRFLTISIVPFLAALMIAIGGFMYLLAYTGVLGPEAISQGHALFKAVIIGLIIVYGAWLIIEAFFAAIGVKEMFRDWSSMNINCPGI